MFIAYLIQEWITEIFKMGLVFVLCFTTCGFFAFKGALSFQKIIFQVRNTKKLSAAYDENKAV